MKLHCDLTNALAVAGLQLIRDGVSDGRIIPHTKRLFEQIESATDPGSRGSSHVERMTVLIKEVEIQFNSFPCEEVAKKVECLGTMCEVVGHNSNQLLEDLIAAFRQKSGTIIQST